jgi:rod shape-determining protein MreC
MAQWSMWFSGSWMNALGDATDWAQLSETNRLVMEENVALRAAIESIRGGEQACWETNMARVLRSPGWGQSPWMVLDQGGRDGLAPGSGIVSVGHAAGKVVDTTAHESLVLTLVHPKAQWSVRMGTQGAAGRLVARNGSVQMAEVRDIPRAQLVLPGDTVTTTGFDGVFPPDIPVGLVDDVEGNEADEFQTVVIALGAQYLSSRHVTWLQSARNAHIDSLTTPPSPSAP